jgi:hypothetical protein
MPRFQFVTDDGQHVFCDQDGLHLDVVSTAAAEAMVKSACNRTACPDMAINVRWECQSSRFRARLSLAIDRLN